ncbi:monocarboxylate transporter 13-like [Athalia rosae]|uniref:monocarboxylate transporter 13-like n=1 Tax=Athalia rosae TaxID=37344 RepID=UPI002033B376|nr:monocarboxylate transporter 13-like [Athalia rosae]XP_012254491.2 monocarboxylate transporter 13-like [Athalia rosae]XP_012254492.2 monocarboxylate transporter 13-like [Athalia rosae]XP_020707608.2 monocarboxylate transporter 13-like [Athalia rosae]XP_048511344.1 monocarboxylate transporter 13-like [Athalia rosae]
MSQAMKARKSKLVPPDGGWGWVVLMSALVVNFLIPGTIKSFGVLFVEFLQVFKSSPTAASWMPALCYFLYSFLGPLSSVLSMKYSYRTVTLMGGTFAAGGMMLSYFANSVTYLYVSYGIMVGIGAGLSFPPTVYIVTSYFKRLRGVANGICISGSAMGSIILPPFLQYLLDNFGYRGAVLIMGAITLNTWVCALLYHPVEQHMIRVPITKEEGVDNEALTLAEIANGKEVANDITTEDVLETANESYHSTAENLPLPDHTKPLDEVQNLSISVEVDKKMAKKEEINFSESVDAPKNGIINIAFDHTDSDLKDNISCSLKIMNIASPNTPEMSRNNSIRHSTRQNQTFRLSRQHSIVSEMGPIALSPRLNVPGMFKSLFKTDASKKPRPVVKNPEQPKDSSDEESDSDKETDGKKKFFDFSVLKDPSYLIILISNSTSAISNTNFMILLPSYAISQGFDKNMSALLLSIVSAFDLIGRISGASLSDIDFVPKYYYFVGGLGTSGIALALLPMANSYTMLSFFCALFGLSSGMYIGITTVILADMLGTEKLSSSYGISLFVNGVLQLVGPPVCGAIFEQVGSYKPIFLAFGIILILGTALWAFLPMIKKNSKKEIESA